MKRPRHNMGRVKWIGAEALGVPGQRTFRLLAYTEAMSAQLWLEKEQLQALAEAVARDGANNARSVADFCERIGGRRVLAAFEKTGDGSGAGRFNEDSFVAREPGLRIQNFFVSDDIDCTA